MFVVFISYILTRLNDNDKGNHSEKFAAELTRRADNDTTVDLPRTSSFLNRGVFSITFITGLKCFILIAINIVIVVLVNFQYVRFVDDSGTDLVVVQFSMGLFKVYYKCYLLNIVAVIFRALFFASFFLAVSYIFSTKCIARTAKKLAKKNWSFAKKSFKTGKR